MHILTPAKSDEIEHHASMSKIYSLMIRVTLIQCLSCKDHCKESFGLRVDIEYKMHQGKCLLIPTIEQTLLYTEEWVYIDRLCLLDLKDRSKA